MSDQRPSEVSNGQSASGSANGQSSTGGSNEQSAWSPNDPPAFVPKRGNQYDFNIDMVSSLVRMTNTNINAPLGVDSKNGPASALCTYMCIPNNKSTRVALDRFIKKNMVDMLNKQEEFRRSGF